MDTRRETVLQELRILQQEIDAVAVATNDRLLGSAIRIIKGLTGSVVALAQHDPDFQTPTQMIKLCLDAIATFSPALGPNHPAITVLRKVVAVLEQAAEGRREGIEEAPRERES